ncbi:FkbM family methyltransferase [Actinocorallia sp. API 0066]|uniref:FkbM family methyltransferase n=1 Tax=Actinocorallia sp. API 0066 TaxID=2896846 RepID=UPI001E3E03E5|nr:FkbM family methyltransferase [Actinocorallia sp. API 0066]MCD0452495.1 FkbM family methyltransferase [Actinocorallia sp. API 0066]
MNPYNQPEPYHSQWGEDRWLAENLDLPSNGTFVDVGAGDGRRGSNTLYWESRGWTGLCVDADPRNHAPLARRRCEVSQHAVSATPGLRTFWMYGPRSSLSGLNVNGHGYTPVRVEVRTLASLLQRANIDAIDLLSIDVEGTELDVWASFAPDLHRPGIVLIEYDDRVPERSTARIIWALGTRYELLHRTPSNLILRRKGYPWNRSNA